MKKVLVFLLLIISIYSQEDINLIKLYDEKKYKEITEIYITQECNNAEFELVFTKAILSKNLEALKNFKNIGYFEDGLLKHLLELDDVKLFYYYKENNFLGEDKQNYKDWIYQGISMDSDNIVKELLKNAEAEKISIESLDLLNMAFEQGSFEIFSLIFDKTSRLDYLDFYPNNQDLSAKINYILQVDSNKSILNQEMLNDIIFYYLSCGEYGKVKEILEKYKEIKIGEELKTKLLVLSAEKKDYEYSKSLIKEIEICSEYLDSKEITNFMTDKNIEKLLIENNKDVNDLLSITINEFVKNNKLDEFEIFLNTNYNFKNKNLQENMFCSVISWNNLKALEILKKYNLLNYERDVEVFSKAPDENDSEMFKSLFTSKESKDGIYIFDILTNYNRPEIAEFIIDNEKDIEKKERIKQNMFVRAAIKNNKAMVNYFLDKGLNINRKDEYGKTVLYYVMLNFCNFNYENVSEEAIVFLKEKGADFNKIDNKKSVLTVAIENNGSSEVIEFLLQFKLDINYVDENGYTAYDYVKQFNIKEIDELFKKYMKK